MRLMSVAAFCAMFTIGASQVRATLITDNINFSLTGGSPAPSGSFTYNTTTNSFTTFTVSWAGILFDLTASVNAPSVNGTPTSPCTGSATPANIFQDLTNPSQCASVYWQAVYNSSISSEEFDIFAYSVAQGQLPDLAAHKDVSNSQLPTAIGNITGVSSVSPEPSMMYPLTLVCALTSIGIKVRRKRMMAAR